VTKFLEPARGSEIPFERIDPNGWSDLACAVLQQAFADWDRRATTCPRADFCSTSYTRRSGAITST